MTVNGLGYGNGHRYGHEDRHGHGHRYGHGNGRLAAAGAVAVALLLTGCGVDDGERTGGGKSTPGTSASATKSAGGLDAERRSDGQLAELAGMFAERARQIQSGKSPTARID
ncbi:hypothetical protein [Streptomyces jumonjinensis]|uniref:hypothetical protein n=1 Tax=Streptomyces jumonjinensis TaxID=1945 RepID=UPI0037A203B5